jgi:hypothetical protein
VCGFELLCAASRRCVEPQAVVGDIAPLWAASRRCVRLRGAVCRLAPLHPVSRRTCHYPSLPPFVLFVVVWILFHFILFI